MRLPKKAIEKGYIIYNFYTMTVKYSSCHGTALALKHGGQVTLFGLVLYTPPGSGSFEAGFYKTTSCDLYVSKGLGTLVLPFRLGARPEIAVFEF